MLKIVKGGNAFRLIETVYICGDYPTSKLWMLGSSQTLRNIVRTMAETQDYENVVTSEKIYGVKVLTVIGKIRRRTIRLLPSAETVIKWITGRDSDKVIYRSSGNSRYIERRHRVAVGAVMFRNAGVEFREYNLPELQNERISRIITDKPCFYTSDALKKVGEKKTYRNDIFVMDIIRGDIKNDDPRIQRIILE